jgi:hypothetical protein
VLQAVLTVPYAQPRHILRAAECGLDEWARGVLTGPGQDRALKELVRDAAAWLGDRDHTSDLTELWVIGVEVGLWAGEISPRMAKVERFIRESGEDLLKSRLSRLRLRRALRLSAA